MIKRKTHPQQAMRNTRKKVLSFELWFYVFRFNFLSLSKTENQKP